MSRHFVTPNRRGWRGPVAVAALMLATPPLAAQTDYFNTDRGRPLHVQDATAIERYALELQFAPARWSRAVGPRVSFAVEPSLAYGLLPRTQIEIGLPVYFTDGFDGDVSRGAGAVHLSLLHALNTETLGLPGLALEGSLSVPAGDFGPDRPYGALGMILTRTVPFGRLHLNADFTVGPSVAAGTAPLDAGAATAQGHLSRWIAGLAVDRALPLRSLLVGAEVVARQPIVPDADLHWEAAAGIRWQASPQWAIDAGAGRSFGDEREWSITFGAARALGLLHLIPAAR